MKILHIAYHHGKNDSRIIQKECMSLMKNGFEVFYTTSNCGESEEIPEGICFISLKKKNDSLLVNYFINRELLQEYFDIIDQIKPEIVHIHEYGISFLVKLIKKQYRNIKVIYDVHEDNAYMDYENDIKRYGRLLANVLVFLRRHKEKVACKYADIVIAATPHIQELLENNSRKIVTIKNYPVNDVLHSSNSDRKNIVCYVGGLTETRGIADLVSVSEKMKGNLYLAGPIENDYKKMLINKYQESYQKSWFYMGVLSRKEVNELYAESRIGVCTLKNIRNHYQALPIKLFEYMAAGLPVIVSAFPMWKEIVEEAGCGFCVDEENVEEIVDRINYLLTHEELANKMGENGRKAVLEKYSWKTEEKKLLKVYNDLL